MGNTILITGGGGFIGSHLANELLSAGYDVRVLDVLIPQVHGAAAERPLYLNPDAEFINGDLRDPETLRKALRGVEGVFHLAAAVGVGQSMYQIEHYTSINNIGTAVLLEALLEKPVGKLVVASSMSIYGEGLYRDVSGRIHSPPERSLNQLRAGRWDLTDAGGGPLHPVPTPETKVAMPASVYALSKYDQEKLCLITGRAYNIPTAAMRFFNAYGPHQALSNPYTGVLAIFAARLLNGNPPLIFEDGLQKRDFVSVYDVARACRLAYETEEASDQVFNVGSGEACTVREVAATICHALNKEHIEAQVSGKFRQGDIRHCYADITRARMVLGYEPEVTLEKGVMELAEWLEGQIAVDRVEAASAELAKRGLTL
jgi:dTDP-L-rhamnose 4-epimerase